MVVVTTVGGFLGEFGFEKSYFINSIGFISMLLIAFCLPDTGTVKTEQGEKLEMTPRVWTVTALGALEMLFLITFSTNIAMHLGGSLAGSTVVSGNLTGVFSGAQIVMGLILGTVTKATKKYTLPIAMLSFSVGGLLVMLFPANYGMLIAGAVFCGFSQGMFIPTAMVEVSNAVKPAATAMAAACLTCGNCFGQFISPTVLNTASKLIFGETATSHVYLLAVIGMTAAAAAVILCTKKKLV